MKKGKNRFTYARTLSDPRHADLASRLDVEGHSLEAERVYRLEANRQGSPWLAPSRDDVLSYHLWSEGL